MKKARKIKENKSLVLIHGFSKKNFSIEFIHFLQLLIATFSYLNVDSLTTHLVNDFKRLYLKDNRQLSYNLQKL